MPKSKKSVPGEEVCELGPAVDALAARWKGQILWFLQDGPKRFMELRRAIPGVSPKVLTHKLRELERDGLILREHHPEIPPRVEYSMTPLGRSAVPVLEAIETWWKRSGAKIEKSRQAAVDQPLREIRSR